MQHSYRSAAELAADESFVNWVKNGCPEEDRYWPLWLDQDPGHPALATNARQIIHVLSQDEEELRPWEQEQIWQQLTQACQQHALSDKARVLPLRFFRSRVAAAAAGLIALAGGWALYQRLLPAPLVYATAYGEKRTVRLPDQSTVMLNAHSRLTVPAQWDAGESREVYLEGEAFFAVQPTAGRRKFRVHTPDGVQVEVLGTEFSVSDRGAVNRVVLASGRVRLKLAAGAGNPARQVEMQPGQLVDVAEQSRQVSRKAVDPARYLGWTHNKLILDNTSLGEIAHLLTQDYGCQVIFADKSLAARRLTASFEVTSLEGILQTLAETFAIQVEKQDKKIIFSKPSVNQSNNPTTYAK